jgi:DNA-binding response OmpR family regulator
VAAGFAVRAAYDGAAGLKMGVAERPDAVVCDIALPRLDGFDVARAVVTGLSDKPLLIAVTAFSGLFPEDRARAAGFDHYLAKPADPFAVESLISDYIKRTRARNG